MSKLRPLFKNNEFEGIYMVPGSPFLYIEALRMLVLADLHLGFEEAVARGLDYMQQRSSYAVGMFIPRIQLHKIKEYLDLAFNVAHDIRKVLINGDLKHAFDRLLRQERKEIKDLLDYLLRRGVEETIIVRGNHDNYLPFVLKDYGIEPVREYFIEINDKKILFTHGHYELDISGYDLIIIGHEHPSLKCFATYRFPAFLKIPTKTGNYIIVLPASSPYHPGTTVSLYLENYLSPLLKKYAIIGEARPIIWIELGETIDITTSLASTTYTSLEIIDIDFYKLDKKEVAVMEFSDLETALIICGLY